MDTTASFDSTGTYVLRLTANDGSRSSSDDVTVTASQANPPLNTVYLSTKGSAALGGVTYKDEDIFAYDVATGVWTMYFDGSDVGVGPADIDAFAILDDGSILMSFLADVAVPGIVGTVHDTDIVQFVPTTLGNTTAGVFNLYIEGSTVGLDSSGEDIDAIAIAPDGRLVISTAGKFTVNGGALTGKDEDLIALTNGTWTMYFDGSDVGLSTATSEDINGAWIDATGHIYLTTLGTFSATGASGDGDDIFRCVPGTLGSTTTCTFNHTWDGAGDFDGTADPGLLPASAVIDGMKLIFNP
jgi:hypothetical protein